MPADNGLPALPAGRYLLTGATGLVGSHVLDLLLQAGVGQITATFHATPPSTSDPRCLWRRTDLSDAGACAEAIAGHDYVIHAAGYLAAGNVLARDPVTPIRRNLAVTGNVHEAAWRAGVRRLVWFSSTTGYPAGIDDLSEEHMFQGNPPDGWYGLGWAHRFLETQSRMYAEKLSPAMDVIALRPSLIYGPRPVFDEQSAHFIYAFVRRVIERESPIVIWGDGSQARDMIHAHDVARASLHAMAHGSGHAAYNIAAGNLHSTREVLEMLLQIDGWTDADVRYDAARGGGKPGGKHFQTGRAARELSFQPQVALEDGLRALVAHQRTAGLQAAGKGH